MKMETILEGPQNENADIQDVDIVSASNWNNQTEENPNTNATLLYIAVEYVKDYKIEGASSNITTRPEVYPDFDQHVSPLDPNMSSVARYSPVYNEPSAEYNPVVIHQLVSQDGTVTGTEQFVNNLSSPLGGIPTVLCNREVNNEFLQMVDGNSANLTNPSTSENLHIVPEREQQVELLITDEATGISYSVNAQELLVEHCLQEDQQLLEALAPNPILESDLLTLDENTLKTELNDDIDVATNTVSSVDARIVDNYITSLSDNSLSKTLNSEGGFKMETRQTKRNELEVEDQLLSCVYSITDKPILSRAKATLPEAYLVIGKIGEENAVFAKKSIPKRAQFGPLEGVISLNDAKTVENGNRLNFLIESEGVTYKVDVSDENSSNWMGFVRKASTFAEQNVVITQENNAIFFTTTANILPKQELKVGYSSTYAQYYNLPALQPLEKLTWPCYECSSKFESSEELQKHLNVHDDDADENVKPRKKAMRTKKKLFRKYQSDAVECNVCEEVFVQYNFYYLRSHLMQNHGFVKGNVEEYFTVVMHYKCDICKAMFKSDAVLKIHGLEHKPDSSDEQSNHICPGCQRKFPTQKQLVGHVMQHAITKNVVVQEKVKCPICSKLFAERERLQKHMLVHGSDEAKPLECKTCRKRFLNNSALACHVKTHYVGKKIFECPICLEGFETVVKLKRHVPDHCRDDTFTCPHCGKAFGKYSVIRKHIRAFHCERTHECRFCGKMFTTADKLRVHSLRHSDHREFLCADCGKQFKRKDKLKEHCKRSHLEERENAVPKVAGGNKKKKNRKFTPKVEPTDFHRFIYKCHACLVGFKRRGMLVNHLAKRHPEIPPDSVPELNLPILQTTRDYYCQYCDKIYKSSSKRKAHILKNHPGAALPMSNRKRGSSPQDVSGLPNPTFSQTVGSITTSPQSCKWCHKQYASKAKLLQHQRKKHIEQASGDMSMETDVSNNINDEKINGRVDTVTEFDKVVEKIMSNDLNDYNLEEDSEFCRLSINENESFIETGELENPGSHLYRLLTTNNGLMPPR